MYNLNIYDMTCVFVYVGDFRLFVGNLGREVNDHMLSVPFMQYPSFIKAHVVKNRETSMSRGCYGFVSFRDSADYLHAMKELHGIIIIYIYFTYRISIHKNIILQYL